MDLDELLQLKKDIDNINLKYCILKNRKEELAVLLDTKNLNIPEEADENKKSRSFKRNLFMILAILCIYTTGFMVEAPILICFVLSLIILSVNNKINEVSDEIDKEEREEKLKEEYKKLLEEKDIVKGELDKVRTDFIELSTKYDDILSKLNREEYKEYLESLSQYLFKYVKNAEHELSEAQDAYDYDIDQIKLSRELSKNA